ncbi:MAG: indolepyruvate ferredoxin oxidoreductase family protein [Paracoccaceae bacterium]
MDLREVKLSDRYDLETSPVLLSGTQALVRATLMQRARDRAAGHDTAGYVTGYRGSPLGAVDGAFEAARKYLEPAPVRVAPGLNEDLAATALWGSQQAHLRGEGKHQGVFGLWYGKGPGVDRTGDVFRHANLAGTAPLGGVLAAMGDDHTCESSTTCHQSEMAFMDAMIPVLSPASVQDLLDMMIAGWELSRFAGTWVGVKAIKDIVEATAVVDGDPHRLALARPADFEMPTGGLGIRLGDTPHALEARLVDYKRFAAQAFVRANGLDGRRLGPERARIGLVASGKAWTDLLHALETLGLMPALETLGISVYKVGLVWPLEPHRLTDWARGLEKIVVIEEKRAIIETQVKEVLYNLPDRPRVVGWKDEAGQVLFSAKLDLDPARVARGLAQALADEGIAHPPMADGLARIERAETPVPELAERKPWFCAGCPHNTSTAVPDGSRAYAGIGCHYMVQWMDRETEGFTHMGGEGANWIGEAPFSTRAHVFQNMGDGTYNHSGLMAIRAAIYSGANITYKILYNDAVAMTGGQRNEGGLSPRQIAEETLAAGAVRVVAVVEAQEVMPELPPNVAVFPREDLARVQRELRETPGTTILLYVQTCAAEKRRRRKRGRFPDPDTRVYINPAVCEGCGDCGVQSNCVAVLPLETPLGRKRQIDQSACNKDFSCLKGFCPSFVTLEGALPKAAEPDALRLPALPEPTVPALDRRWNLLITGIGGTGVVTVGALLSMAAHLEGKAASEMQMAGLAQKGGAVAIHCRLAPRPEDIFAVRISAGEADAVIGGDPVVTAAPKAISTMADGRTGVIYNTHETVTGQFTRDREFALPSRELRAQIEARVGVEALRPIAATRLAERLLGDAIFANVMLLGAAWQAGLVPLSRAALLQAVRLNGAAVEKNTRAFEMGRWAIAFPEEAAARLGERAMAREETLAEKIDRRAAFLRDYQTARLARRYRAFVERARDAGGDALAEAVAEGYFKLLAYKDEYEVARLQATHLAEGLAADFEGVRRITFHLAPPLISRPDETGRPRKIAFGPWILPVFRLLRHGKRLRGTPLDPFGWTAERRAERRAIRRYRRTMSGVFARLGARPDRLGLACEIARLPLSVRGFGPVKAEAAARAAEEERRLLAELDAETAPAPVAQAAE